MSWTDGGLIISKAGEARGTHRGEMFHSAGASEDSTWTDSLSLGRARVAKKPHGYKQMRTRKLTGKPHGQGEKVVVFYWGRGKSKTGPQSIDKCWSASHNIWTIWQEVNGPSLLIYLLSYDTQLGATGLNDAADEEVWRGGLRDVGGEQEGSRADCDRGT